MEYKKLKEINEYKSESINPMKTPDVMYELYSVPFFATGHPEYLHGSEIGSSKVIVRRNDILVCKINPRINRVWVVADESNYQSIASSEWIVIRTNRYNPYFLAWYFRTPMFQQLMTSEVTGIGGSLTRAQPKRVAEYPVPVLARERQDKIVSILGHLESIKCKRKSELDLLDSLVKARFVEMFGDPSVNPMFFPVKKLKDVCKIGSSKRVYQHEQTTKGVPFFRVSDLTAKIQEQKVKPTLYISEDKYLNLKKNGLVPMLGDILVTARGTIGLCYILQQSDRFYFQDGMISWIHSHGSRINPIFLKELFRSAYIQNQISKSIAGSTVAYLSISQLGNFNVLLPSIEKQNIFADFIKHVEKSKVAIQKSLDETQILFQSLMQEYFG